ncbi:MAG: ferritin-like domain-containing protein, partial [Candidatus Kapaibacterium sp.]
AVGLQGCSDDENPMQPDGSIDLGSGDVGVLNYAYALEQLEAAYYIKVMESPYAGMSSDEMTILSEIRDHEIAHRDFFKAAIPAGSRIPDLEVNFSSVDFNSRISVLETARAFEDLGVSAYNGAGYLLENETYLGLAGKIVSVEARHASSIRDLLQPGTAYYAGDDVVVAGGLDVQRKPSEVLSIAGAYISSNVTANNLP